MTWRGVGCFVRDIVIGVVLLAPIALYFGRHVLEPRSAMDSLVIEGHDSTRVLIRDPRSGACAAFLIQAPDEPSVAAHDCPDRAS